MPEGKIVPLSEILEKYQNQNNYRNISEVLNVPIVVTGVEFEERPMGIMTIVHTTNKTFYTFSDVLRDQFEKIQHYLENNPDVGGISVVVKKKKRYYYLDSPE